jgi:hypothetical protein
MVSRKRSQSWFDNSVQLPPGFGGVGSIRKAIDYMERELADLSEIYFEQANVFSALVGIFGTKALDSVSNYEKSRHSYTAQQRFPDLCRRGCHTPPESEDCLESKASKRRGPFNLITTILGGTSYGVISLIQPNPWNAASRLSFGVWTLSIWRRPTGNTKRAVQVRVAAGEPTPLESKILQQSSTEKLSTGDLTS